jgi:peptide deformylase
MRLCLFGDPILRERAREVHEFDEGLVREARALVAAMDEADGVGLAATQMGALRRVFVMRPEEEGPERVFVNPTVEPLGEDTEMGPERCLSLPGVCVEVERATHVLLRAQDALGRAIQEELHGHEARVAQHEADHLDGILIIDRATRAARREALLDLCLGRPGGPSEEPS